MKWYVEPLHTGCFRTKWVKAGPGPNPTVDLCACICNPGFIIPVSCCRHCITARDSHTSSTLSSTSDYVLSCFCFLAVAHLSESPPGPEWFWTNDSWDLGGGRGSLQWAFRSQFKLCAITKAHQQDFTFFHSFIEDKMDRHHHMRELTEYFWDKSQGSCQCQIQPADLTDHWVNITAWSQSASATSLHIFSWLIIYSCPQLQKIKVISRILLSTYTISVTHCPSGWSCDHFPL